jgi:hypothetical protein
MGPTADQELLELIASSTGGRYYYMPTIDDLFEVYNYMRGQILGDALVANESATASSSRVPVFFDPFTREAMVTVAWANPKLAYVANAAKGEHDVSVRLRAPNGRLLPENSSLVQRIVGQGTVAFKLEAPQPGRWYVEVSTAGNTHVRYTVGGFAKSSLRLFTKVAARARLGRPIEVISQVVRERQVLRSASTEVQVVAPAASVKTLLERHKVKLQQTDAPKFPGGDVVPADIGKLIALRTQQLQAGGADLFAHRTTVQRSRELSVDELGRRRDLALSGIAMTTDFEHEAASASRAPSGVLVTRLAPPREAGTHNIIVVAQGVEAGHRYVRKELLSVRVE